MLGVADACEITRLPVNGTAVPGAVGQLAHAAKRQRTAIGTDNEGGPESAQDLDVIPPAAAQRAIGRLTVPDPPFGEIQLPVEGFVDFGGPRPRTRPPAAVDTTRH